ncbi:MAG: cysteine--tRNA ligase [Planctomycetota bacterium]|jgi:cysteinyl-tRNA synthetase
MTAANNAPDGRPAPRFHNTYTRSAQVLEPLEEGRVRMYNCGPTVYGRQHIGNFRAFLFADLLRRWLEDRGYAVRQVMNITDVGHLVGDADEGEDKMVAQAKKEGRDPWEISRHWAAVFLDDLGRLRVQPAHEYPRATDHVEQMLEIIRALEEKGFAYRAGEGGQDVYFDVTQFERYGQLSGNRLEDLQAGARIEVRDEKRHPADFALWKSDPAHLMKWQTEYGEHGFPGWHIECSAMAREHLGDQIDIHTGGEDNVFPHHECEIAQSEAFTGERFSGLWMHTKFLQVDGGKMSKSLGNIYTLDDVEGRGHSIRELRFALMRGHYRSPLNFTWGILEECKAALEGLDELRARLAHVAAANDDADGAEALRQAVAEFERAMDDDLNTPAAMAALFTLRDAALNGPFGGATARGALEFLERADRVFGFIAPWETVDADEDAEIDAMVKARDAARDAKDWGEADRLRDELTSRGIVLQDSDQGTIWRRG